MAASRKYQITWPLTAESATQIDEMFDELYRQAADTATTAAITTLVLAAETKGSLLYVSDTAGTIDGLPAVATGNAVISQGTLTAPVYGKITLTGHVSGTLPVANGGTGATTLTGILQGNGASAVTVIANSSTVGQILRVTGAATYAWGALDLADTDAVTGILAAVNGGTGLALYAVGDLLYADTTTTLAKLADAATGNALISGGVGVAPSYGKIGLTTHISGILALANGGSGANLSATGGAGQFVKQNSVGGVFTVGTAASTVLSDTANIAYLNAANVFTAQQTVSNAAAAAAVLVKGWDPITGIDATDNGALRVGGGSIFGQLHFEGKTSGYLYLDHTWDSASGRIYFRTRTSGTAVNNLILDGAGLATFGAGISVATTSLLIGTVTLGTNALLTLGANSYIKAGTALGFTVDNSADTAALFQAEDTGKFNFYNAQATIQASVSTAGLITCKNLTDSGLTAGRVVFADTGGLLAGDADMTFATDTLTVTKIVASTSVNITGSLQCDSIVNDTGLASGVYTPTVTGVANTDAVTAYECQYLRVGSTVTVSGKFDVDPTLAVSTLTRVRISLPVASNLGAAEDLCGAGSAAGTVGNEPVALFSDTANDAAEASFASFVTGNHSIFFTFTYQVI